MSDYEYEEANLDDFMLRAGSALTKENSPDMGTIVDSLHQHLSSIIKSQPDIDSFFGTLNGVIFGNQNEVPSKPIKIKNKNVFRLYPLIYSFNPKGTSSYIDYFLGSLDLSTCDSNRSEFSLLSQVFGEVIKSFYDNRKKGLALLEKDKKNLFEKFLN